MQSAKWPDLQLAEGVVREFVLNDTHLALWLKGEQGDGFLAWERIWTVPPDDVRVAEGIWAVAALARPMRQEILSRVQRFLRRCRRDERGPGWTLPTGDQAEPCGPKETDLILVWAEGESTSLDEVLVKTYWPEARHVRRLGRNLFVARGVQLRPPDRAPEAPSDAAPDVVAGQLSAAAEQNSDLLGKSMALTDLGVLSRKAGNFHRAVEQLTTALELVQSLGERSRECDVLGNLGIAVMDIGDYQRAAKLFDQELVLARSTNDRFAEKLALEHSGVLCSRRQDFADAISYFDQALAVAHECADRRQQILLRWQLAIQYAESGRTGDATLHGELAVRLMRETGDPKAAWFDEQLAKFRSDQTASGPVAVEILRSGLSGMESNVSIAGDSAIQGSPPVSTTEKAGLLRMALSATSAMAKFVGSGFKKVSKEVFQARIGTCTTCEHHTGLRCRVCGCFTNTKAWLPYEDCPLKKWPEARETKRPSEYEQRVR
jgi:tetratricopeptide (TPR) repeat protein